MKKIILVSLILIAAIVPFFIFKNITCPFKRQPGIQIIKSIEKDKTTKLLNEALVSLKFRKDRDALVIFEMILLEQPDNLDALWGKAEILRRAYNFEEAEKIFNDVLVKCPGHASSLISLSYIRYHDNKFSEALKILKQVLKQLDLERENKALAYMLIGSINAKKASLGGFFCKVVYGTRIKGCFEKAKSIAPDLAEVRLGLGSFYLLAPKIAGGDVDRAIEELECAVQLTPDFATANARLAQAYRKKQILDKYNFYLQRAKELDPDNEVVKEIETSL